MPIMVRCKSCKKEFSTKGLQTDSKKSFDKMTRSGALLAETCPHCGKSNTYFDSDLFLK